MELTNYLLSKTFLLEGLFTGIIVTAVFEIGKYTISIARFYRRYKKYGTSGQCFYNGFNLSDGKIPEKTNGTTCVVHVDTWKKKISLTTKHEGRTWKGTVILEGDNFGRLPFLYSDEHEFGYKHIAFTEHNQGNAKALTIIISPIDNPLVVSDGRLVGHTYGVEIFKRSV